MRIGLRSCPSLTDILHAMPAESGVKSRIAKALRERGCYVVSVRAPVVRGDPDLVCSVPPSGKFVGIEVKQNEGTTDPVRKRLQDNRIRKIQRSGGEAGYAYSVEDALHLCGLE